MAKIAVLIGKSFEDVEYTEPADALREAGHELVHLSSEEGSVQGKQGARVDIDGSAADADVAAYDALFIPGGHSPDNLRADQNVVDLVREFMDSGKPVFAICHGPQLLMTAGRVDGRRLTAWSTIQRDLEYTAAEVVDEAVVEDGNLVTSRNPDDIPGFTDRMLDRLEAAT